ncbi:MarR family transcriptional regulator [Streptomyces sp. BR123]|uniref:MarR family transcriptional regulator n=1 Tax=Streptomyces sp. BR123 TaxID=2749828 RepID=UPI0015C4E1EC|nr:MarR family transcriptional regulator [Streptomyces sp. BR123]NXY93913.1 MarR family transcriptional regulator [Streptomyces sp. BR123]
MAPGDPLSKTVFLSLRLTARLLFTLGAVYALTAQQHFDHGGTPTALCLSVCAAGLFAEDLLQGGYRWDRAVFAHIAVHPGVNARQTARAVDIAEKVVPRSLDRFACDGIVAAENEANGRSHRSFRLAP